MWLLYYSLNLMRFNSQKSWRKAFNPRTESKNWFKKHEKRFGNTKFLIKFSLIVTLIFALIVTILHISKLALAVRVITWGFVSLLSIATGGICYQLRHFFYDHLYIKMEMMLTMFTGIFWIILGIIFASLVQANVFNFDLYLVCFNYIVWSFACSLLFLTLVYPTIAMKYKEKEQKNSKHKKNKKFKRKRKTSTQRKLKLKTKKNRKTTSLKSPTNKTITINTNTTTRINNSNIYHQEQSQSSSQEWQTNKNRSSASFINCCCCLGGGNRNRNRTRNKNFHGRKNIHSINGREISSINTHDSDGVVRNHIQAEYSPGPNGEIEIIEDIDDNYNYNDTTTTSPENGPASEITPTMSSSAMIQGMGSGSSTIQIGSSALSGMSGMSGGGYSGYSGYGRSHLSISHVNSREFGSHWYDIVCTVYGYESLMAHLEREFSIENLLFISEV